MKYVKNIILILILFLSFNTYGYTLYDYDISRLYVDSNDNVIIKGYGRLYVGSCTSTSGECWDKYPVHTYNANKSIDSSKSRYIWSNTTKQYGSGDGSTAGKVGADYDNCTLVDKNGIDYRYTFTLDIVKVDANGNALGVAKSMTMSKTDSRKDTVNLSYALCPKDGACSTASSYTSGCYKDVGFYFTFNLKERDANGRYLFSGSKLKLKLTITSAWGKSDSFYMGIDSTALDNSAKPYISDSYVRTTVRIQANDPRTWNGAGYSYGKLSDRAASGGTYTIRDGGFANGQPWYKICYNTSKADVSCSAKKAIEGWVPAAWVYPITSGTLVFEPKGVDEIETCNPTSISNSMEVKEYNSLDSTTISFDRNTVKTTCNLSESEYYSKSCTERVKVKSHPSIKEKLRVNNSIDYSLDLEAYQSCNYTFNYVLWNNEYNAQKEYLNGDLDEVNRAIVNNNIKKLENYISLYNSLVSSSYNFTPNATLKVGNGKTVNFVFDKTNNDSRNSNIWNNKTTTPHVLSNGVTVYDYSYGSKDDDSLLLSGKFKLNKLYLLEEPGEALNVLVNVNKLASHEKWFVVGNGSIEVKDQPITFRMIDENNPFDFRKDNFIGSNWKNDEFDFTEIIKPSSSNEFEFYLSKENLNNIKKDLDNGILTFKPKSGCVYQSTTDRYKCSFLRNSKYVKDSVLGG